MIVALGLPLNAATIILDSIFSVLFGDFRACGPISTSTPPIVALTCRCRDKHPSIVGIVVFYIFAMNVSVFWYAYYVYVMIYCRSCELR